MLTIEEARGRVAVGAAHLDRVRPGWENQIDVGTLTLRDPCRCIVGQLCGADFVAGLRALAIPEQWLDFKAKEFGFALLDIFCMEKYPYEKIKERYAMLQDAWVEAIYERRVAASLTRGHAAPSEKATRMAALRLASSGSSGA